MISTNADDSQQPNDDYLLRELQSKDEARIGAALSIIYSRYLKCLVKISSTLVGASNAEDVVQNVMREIYRNAVAGKLGGYASLPAFLVTITQRRAIDLLKKKATLENRDTTFFDQVVASKVESDELHTILASAIQEVLSQLGSRDRLIITCFLELAEKREMRGERSVRPLYEEVAALAWVRHQVAITKEIVGDVVSKFGKKLALALKRSGAALPEQAKAFLAKIQRRLEKRRQPPPEEKQ